MALDLVSEWIKRMRGDASRSLGGGAAEELVPELLTAYTPAGFTLDVDAESSVTQREDGIDVALSARLVPVEFSIDDPDAPSGVIQRLLSTGQGWARHDRFDLPPDWQGESRGRTVLRDSALLYDELGITAVTLDAVDIGRYVWAMCGFDFGLETDRNDVLQAVTELAAGLGFAPEDLESVEHSWEIGFVEADEAITMRQVAEALGESVEHLGGDPESWEQEILPGKALLLYADYPGYEAVLDLTQESPGRQQMLDYTDV